MDLTGFDNIKDSLPNHTRRDFLKFCSAITATLALPTNMTAKVAQSITNPDRLPVVWISGAECTGCTMSLFRTDHQSIESLIFDTISLEYHNALQNSSGKEAKGAIYKTIEKYEGKFLLVIEGAIPLKDGGVSCRSGGHNFVHLVEELGEKAGGIIAIGSCAVWGGFLKVEPNITGCVGVRDVLKSQQIVNIPGCPPNPYNLLSTIIHYITFKKFPKLDDQNRPLFIFDRLIHDHCERRGHFDNGRFAKEFGDEAHRLGHCLYHLGCKGPVTHANCPTLNFGDAGSGCWPVAIGHPCFGCTEEGVGFEVEQFEVCDIKHATPPAYHPPIKPDHKKPIGVGAAAFMAGVAGAALGAGAVFVSSLKSKSVEDNENEKA